MIRSCSETLKPSFPQFVNPLSKPQAAPKKTTNRPKVAAKKAAGPKVGIYMQGKNTGSKMGTQAGKQAQPSKNAFSFTQNVLGVKSGTTVTKAVFEMDLWAPVKDSNQYGARRQKSMAVGKLSKNSYVPAGMSKADYDKIRTNEKQAKTNRYNKYAAKKDEYGDFQDFYVARGTDKNAAWKSVTNNHAMCKTKYDWQGDNDMAGFGSTGR